jgi:hypothetical protein
MIEEKRKMDPPIKSEDDRIWVAEDDRICGAENDDIYGGFMLHDGLTKPFKPFI